MGFVPTMVIAGRVTAASGGRFTESRYSNLVVQGIRSYGLCNNLRLRVLQTQQPLVFLHQQENLIIVHDANVGLCERRYSADKKWKCKSDKNDPTTIVVPKFLQKLRREVVERCLLANLGI
jgi:hypothetical protein